MPISRHVPALDGVRGIAILMVMLVHYRTILTGAGAEHAVFTALTPGWAGVDLFFVLSGFLITGILLDSKDEPFYFRTFWWRRAVRIFPIYYLYLAVVFVGMSNIYRVFLHKHLWDQINPWWYLTYLANWKPDHAENDPYLSHAWSLCIEEQFYLLWPAVVYWSARKRLAWVCGGIAVAGLGFRCWLVAAHAPNDAIYRLTLTRMDALAMGGLVAIAIRNPRSQQWLNRHAWKLFAGVAAALAAIVIAKWPFEFDNAAVQTGGTSLMEIVFAGVIYFAFTTPASWWLKPFSWAPLRSIGRYSYAIYLYHLAPHMLLISHVQGWLARQPYNVASVFHFLYIGCLMGLSYVAARVSWYLVEGPLLKLKDRNPLIRARGRMVTGVA